MHATHVETFGRRLDGGGAHANGGDCGLPWAQKPTDNRACLCPIPSRLSASGCQGADVVSSNEQGSHGMKNANPLCALGRSTGIEPATSGTTNRRLPPQLTVFGRFSRFAYRICSRNISVCSVQQFSLNGGTPVCTNDRPSITGSEKDRVSVGLTATRARADAVDFKASQLRDAIYCYSLWLRMYYGNAVFIHLIKIRQCLRCFV